MNTQIGTLMLVI